MTQLQSARLGIVTAAMKSVAADEGVEAEAVREAVASGEAVIPLNIHHEHARPIGVGRMFTTKINANLGRSAAHSGKRDELAKLAVALEAGADFVMDLSAGVDDLRRIRQDMLEARGLKGARDWDDEMARARADFDWNRQFSICLDSESARARWLKTRTLTDEAHADDHCSMCGKQFCAVRTSRRIRALSGLADRH